jgi:hypothetical protein
MVNGERVTAKTALTEAPGSSPFESEIPEANVNLFALNLLNDRTSQLGSSSPESSINNLGLGSLPVLELVDPGLIARGRNGLPGQDPAFEEGLGYDDKLYEPMNPRDERRYSPPSTRNGTVRRG